MGNSEGRFFGGNDDWEALKVYLQDIKKYRKIDEEEEKKLLLAVANEVPDSRNRLVELSLGLPLFIAKKYKRQHPDVPISLADLVAAGNLGLVKASRLFDAHRHLRFSTMAFIWIHQYVVQAANDCYPLQLPRAVKRKRQDLQPQDYDPSLSWTTVEKIDATLNDGDSAAEELATKRLLALYAAIEKLPPTDRYLLTAYYGLLTAPRQSAKELAVVYHCNTEAIYRRLKKITRTLFARLKEQVRP